MKKTFLLLFLICIFGCDKDDKPANPIDQLPPATQTGAGTFGCLVNGVPYVDNSGFFNCFYQLVDGEYYFSISAESSNSTPRNIRISTRALELTSDSIYQLVEPADGNAHAAVIFNFNGVQPNINTTDMQNSGSLKIIKLDLEKNIISGIFNFQISDTVKNKVYNITEGRFDAKFTQ